MVRVTFYPRTGQVHAKPRVHRPPVRPSSGPRREEAIRFLLGELRFGPARAKDLFATARDRGISERTLRRARNDLGIITVRRGFGAGVNGGRKSDTSGD